MQQAETQILIKLGLSPTAAKIYLTLVELGSSSADKIAKKAGTYKANAYDALEKLESFGLAAHTIEDGKRLFLPTSPEKLPQIIEEWKDKQLKAAEELKKDIENFIPQLQAKYDSIKEKDTFEIYRGRKAYKALINEIIKEKPKFWKGFGNLQIAAEFPAEFQKWFRHVGLIKLFSNRSEKVLQLKKEAEKICKVDVCWLPKEVYMPIVWVIFGQNVLIIIYEPDIILLRIKSDNIV
ncbi:helix-turn-helix domain-containing protein, partial [Candidatus Woesearchaeota archaeon]|nr:helix-turn-helix domain-containing protein [Candidatus Woesearchaeota archaeon]